MESNNTTIMFQVKVVDYRRITLHIYMNMTTTAEGKHCFGIKNSVGRWESDTIKIKRGYCNGWECTPSPEGREVHELADHEDKTGMK